MMLGVLDAVGVSPSSRSPPYSPPRSPRRSPPRSPPRSPRRSKDSPSLSVPDSNALTPKSKLRTSISKMKSAFDAVGATETMKTEARRRRGVRFKDYDFDGAVGLDYEEFYSIQPRKIREHHSAARIRKWFDAVCAANGKPGVVSVNDFFLWSLSPAATAFGAGSLGAALKSYDTTPA